VTSAPPGDPDDGVFTDGSATPNPGRGGWAAVYVLKGQVVAELHGGEPATTNNRMELTALIRGIELVPAGVASVLYTDSQLAERTVNAWAPAWEAKGWRRSRGPVENLDLVRTLVERLRSRPELQVAWIRAHVGHRWNEYADRLAARASAD
jgi:ribonuclease HI